MTSLTILSSLILFLRLTYTILFALAFAAKIRQPIELEQTIHKFNLLKPPFIRPVAQFILAIEFVIPLLLIFNYLFAGFVFAFLLLLLFSAAFMAVLSSGTVASCNCFGSQSTPVSAWTLGRNGIFLLSAGLGIWLTTLLDSSINSPRLLEVAIVAPLSLSTIFLVNNLQTIKEILYAG